MLDNLNNGRVPAKVLVINAGGRAVLQKEIYGQETLRIPSAANGVYVVEVSVQGKSVSFERITLDK